MGRMTYVKALMCLLFPSAALVARAQHPVAGDLKCKTDRTDAYGWWRLFKE